MEKQKQAGFAIGLKAFLTSFIILFALMILSGLLTRVLPAGSFDRMESADGLVVLPGTYHPVEEPDYPLWRWFTAPVEVLASPDAAIAIVIIIVIIIMGGSFAVLQKAGILAAVVNRLSVRFSSQKYILLALVSLFFMLIGSLMGIFEEVVTLVPVAVALALAMGWDIMTGLGMSILATGFGFSAAITNPFTIGVAQKLAGLPAFSGSLFRIMVFLIIYGFYMLWLFSYAKKVDKKNLEPVAVVSEKTRGTGFFGISMIIVLLTVIISSRISFLQDLSLPLTALLILISSTVSARISGTDFRTAAKAFLDGVLGLLPGVILILMAMSVKLIIVKGGIMDTILERAWRATEGFSGYGAAATVYLFTLGFNFFIGSATAKAFLLMPILVPLGDLTGVSRQVLVQAFAFGDGFSNMLYPTNAVLLIALGLVGLSWPAWFKRTWLLQFFTLILTMGLLMLAVALGY